jgi:O-succinylbenzoic acid--CoA ligase
MEGSDVMNMQFQAYFQGEGPWIKINPQLPPSLKENLLSQAHLLGQKGHLYLLTSGSTTTPKWVGLKPDSILTTASSFQKKLSLKDQDHWCLCLPTFHIAGISVLARAEVSLSRVFALEKWSAQGFLKKIVEHRCTCASLVPSQLYDLLQTNQVAPDFFRCLLVGAGKVDPFLQKKALELKWPLVESYALTEASGTVAIRKGDQKYFEPLEHIQIESHTDIKMNFDLLESISPSSRNIPKKRKDKSNAKSTLVLRSKTLYEHLLLSSEGVQKREGDTYPTQDLAEFFYQEGKTFFSLLGRTEDHQKVQGEWVFLPELSEKWNALLREQKVTIPAYLIFVPDIRLSQMICCVSTPAHKEALIQCIALFNQNQPGYEAIRCLTLMDRLPLSALNKLCQEDCRQWIDAYKQDADRCFFFKKTP